MNRITRIILTGVASLSFGLFATGCRGNSHANEPDGHAHGPDTHTHDAVAADTAGTYVDSTGDFFNDESGDHEHGEDTHTHASDSDAHH